MNFEVLPLDGGQAEDIDRRLSVHEHSYIKYRLCGEISLGAFSGGTLVGGVSACMTAYKIMYVSTVFVDEAFRRGGVGRALMLEAERRALELGANMIRLDTFDWQGADFYRALGYEQVGGYTSEADGFSEYFFVKRLL